MITALEWGFCCALIGVVYAQVLGNDDTPLNAWFDLLERNKERHPWITKMVGGCYLCTSGQLALWSSLIYHRFDVEMFPFSIVAACSAVIFAALVNKAYQWTTQ